MGFGATPKGHPAAPKTFVSSCSGDRAARAAGKQVVFGVTQSLQTSPLDADCVSPVNRS